MVLGTGKNAHFGAFFGIKPGKNEMLTILTMFYVSKRNYSEILIDKDTRWKILVNHRTNWCQSGDEVVDRIKGCLKKLTGLQFETLVILRRLTPSIVLKAKHAETPTSKNENTEGKA